MVGSSPTLLYSAYFGALNLEKAAILSFPQGLPGFEFERRFAAIQIPGQQPLVYLQSLATPELCLLTLPIQVVQPEFELQLQPEDGQAIHTAGVGANLVTLAVITAEPDGNCTVNLAAPLVVNLENNLAVQAPPARLLSTLPPSSYKRPTVLILRRRVGESILIGDSIEIEITEIGPSKVKVGVRAPVEISVQRKEMASTREQNRRAAVLTSEARAALVKNLSHIFPQHLSAASDMNFEARYSGHPNKKENLEPA